MLIPPVVVPVMSFVHSLRLPERSNGPVAATHAAAAPVWISTSSSAPPATPSNVSVFHAGHEVAVTQGLRDDVAQRVLLDVRVVVVALPARDAVARQRRHRRARAVG